MEKLLTLQEELTEAKVKLVAVSKTHGPEAILRLYREGQRDFGENRVQELLEKQPVLPADIRWHLIGHLQTNKVKYVVPFVHLIHAVDSPKLLFEIDRRAEAIGRVIPCLLQFKIAEEESKFGLSWEEATQLLEDPRFPELKHVLIAGVMGMGTLTDDEAQTRREFRTLKRYFDQLKSTFFPDSDTFRELSMGMSDDYHLAIEEGSTMVRIGSLLFGERE